MKLYNTLTRKIEEIKPLRPPIITVYTCGPTVYDYSHIGHWFNYVRMDTLIRALKISGFNPKWVMNITDVGHLVSDADEGEDKLEKGARREGKSSWEVAEFYTEDFIRGMNTLNILMPDHIVKATDHIQEQVELIKVLEHKGYTYIIDDGVYFDTGKLKNYGALTNLKVDSEQNKARITANVQKRHQSDFALWKFSPKDRKRDMQWDSPWGIGFPGWHIECSAMSMKYLGETIDIHTGGVDHIPVHHTNEIAQSEAATGKPFVCHWMHSEHVMVNDSKISKSMGHNIRLQELASKKLSPLALRLHILESHYRSQAHFSWDNIEAAQNRLKSWNAFADLRWQPNKEIEEQPFIKLKANNIKKSLQDDLDTPRALAELSALIDEIDGSGGLSLVCLHQFESLLQLLDDLFGLKLLGSANINDEQKIMIKERETARAKKDWAKADDLRSELIAENVAVRDTPRGTIWFRP